MKFSSLGHGKKEGLSLLDLPIADIEIVNVNRRTDTG